MKSFPISRGWPPNTLATMGIPGTSSSMSSSSFFIKAANELLSQRSLLFPGVPECDQRAYSRCSDRLRSAGLYSEEMTSWRDNNISVSFYLNLVISSDENCFVLA